MSVKLKPSTSYMKFHKIWCHPCHALISLPHPPFPFSYPSAQEKMQSLSLLDKNKIVAAYHRRKAHNETASQSAITLWDKDTLHFEKIPDQSTDH